MTALFEMRIRVGGDPRDFSEFMALCDELAKLTHPACPDVDWVKVEQLCLALFEKNGAELHTAAYYALARTYLHGLNGMTEGVAMIEVLGCHWPQLWPPIASARIDILSWLFTQLQPLLRSLKPGTPHVPALINLDARLERLNGLLEGRVHSPLIALQSLRQQICNLIQRLERNIVAGQIELQHSGSVEPAWVMPVVILPPPRIHGSPPQHMASKKRSAVLWLSTLVATVCLAGWLGWQIWAATPVSVDTSRLMNVFGPPKIADSVRLGSLSLFDASSVELKAGSTKVLIDALVSIKAQPGWLIVVSGHTDSTGEAGQNLRISHARAVVVRDWMQRMGDIPAECFAVQGLAATRPVATNDTEIGRAANRRVDIHLIPQVGACEQISGRSGALQINNN